MARYLYSELINTIRSSRYTRDAWIEHIEKNLLPSGSGIDSGTRIVLEECHAERLVMTASYHHMDDSGGYDGWTEHKVVVTPSFTGGINLRISGRNRNDIKDYLHEVFYTALCADVTLEWYQYHFDGVPNWQWHHDAKTGATSYSIVLPSPYTKSETIISFTNLHDTRAWIVQWCEANRQELKVREQ